MSGHTPAPWIMELNPKSGMAEILGKRGNGNVRKSDGMGNVGRVDCATIETSDRAAFPDIDAEAEANARLLAAAPELLEALRDCLMHLRENFKDDSSVWVDRGRAAIAKATGTQPTLSQAMSDLTEASAEEMFPLGIVECAEGSRQ